MNGLLVLLGAIGGGAVSALIAAVSTRRKTGAEVEHLEATAADILVRTAAEFTERQARIAADNERKLEMKVAELEAKIDVLTKAVTALAAQVTAAGLTPVVRSLPIVDWNAPYDDEDGTDG